MNTESIELQMYEDVFPDELHPGMAKLQMSTKTRGSLFVVLPGQDVVDCIPVTRDPKAAARIDRLWLLTGTEKKPTLHPSINATGRWHGWLKGGCLKSC